LRSARHFLAGELLLRHFHPAISAASSSAVNTARLLQLLFKEDSAIAKIGEHNPGDPHSE
jgi:hypothetical protein